MLWIYYRYCKNVYSNNEMQSRLTINQVQLPHGMFFLTYCFIPYMKPFQLAQFKTGSIAKYSCFICVTIPNLLRKVNILLSKHTSLAIILLKVKTFLKPLSYTKTHTNSFLQLMNNTQNKYKFIYTVHVQHQKLIPTHLYSLCSTPKHQYWLNSTINFRHQNTD